MEQNRRHPYERQADTKGGMKGNRGGKDGAAGSTPVTQAVSRDESQATMMLVSNDGYRLFTFKALL